MFFASCCEIYYIAPIIQINLIYDCLCNYGLSKNIIIAKFIIFKHDTPAKY